MAALNVTLWSTVEVGGVDVRLDRRVICKGGGVTVWRKVELLPLKFESLPYVAVIECDPT
jgi:hypothetical protein